MAVTAACGALGLVEDLVRSGCDTAVVFGRRVGTGSRHEHICTTGTCSDWPTSR